MKKLLLYMLLLLAGVQAVTGQAERIDKFAIIINGGDRSDAVINDHFNETSQTLYNDFLPTLGVQRENTRVFDVRSCGNNWSQIRDRIQNFLSGEYQEIVAERLYVFIIGHGQGYNKTTHSIPRSSVDLACFDEKDFKESELVVNYGHVYDDYFVNIGIDSANVAKRSMRMEGSLVYGLDVNDDGDFDDWASVDEYIIVGDKRISDDELASWFDKQYYWNENQHEMFFFLNCYSGGFIYDMSRKNRIVMTATDEYSVAWIPTLMSGSANFLLDLYNAFNHQHSVSEWFYQAFELTRARQVTAGYKDPNSSLPRYEDDFDGIGYPYTATGFTRERLWNHSCLGKSLTPVGVIPNYQVIANNTFLNTNDNVLASGFIVSDVTLNNTLTNKYFRPGVGATLELGFQARAADEPGNSPVFTARITDYRCITGEGPRKECIEHRTDSICGFEYTLSVPDNYKNLPYSPSWQCTNHRSVYWKDVTTNSDARILVFGTGKYSFLWTDGEGKKGVRLDLIVTCDCDNLEQPTALISEVCGLHAKPFDGQTSYTLTTPFNGKQWGKIRVNKPGTIHAQYVKTDGCSQPVTFNHQITFKCDCPGFNDDSVIVSSKITCDREFEINNPYNATTSSWEVYSKPTGSNVTWIQGPNTPLSTVNVDMQGDYYFKWSDKSVCPQDINYYVKVNTRPDTLSVTSTRLNYCGLEGWLDITDFHNPYNEQGKWEVVSKPPGATFSLSDTFRQETRINVSGFGEYVFRWTGGYACDTAIKYTDTINFDCCPPPDSTMIHVCGNIYTPENTDDWEVVEKPVPDAQVDFVEGNIQVSIPGTYTFKNKNEVCDREYSMMVDFEYPAKIVRHIGDVCGSSYDLDAMTTKPGYWSVVSKPANTFVIWGRDSTNSKVNISLKRLLFGKPIDASGELIIRWIQPNSYCNGYNFFYKENNNITDYYLRFLAGETDFSIGEYNAGDICGNRLQLIANASNGNGRWQMNSSWQEAYVVWLDGKDNPVVNVEVLDTGKYVFQYIETVFCNNSVRRAIYEIEANFTNTLNYLNKDYDIVQIDNRCWFAENLDAGTFVPSDVAQPFNGNQINRYCYNNILSNCDIYGGLYQYIPLMRNNLVEETRGICPLGWHVPTKTEYESLVDYVGINNIEELMPGGTTGFNLQLGGLLSYTQFMNIDKGAYLYTSTQDQLPVMVVFQDGDNYYSQWGGYMGAASVRCIKDGGVNLKNSNYISAINPEKVIPQEKEENIFMGDILTSFINIYPNPARDYVIIHLSGINHINASLEILDVSGKIQIHQSIQNITEVIHLSGLIPGIYFVKVKTPENSWVKKIIIKN